MSSDFPSIPGAQGDPAAFDDGMSLEPLLMADTLEESQSFEWSQSLVESERVWREELSAVGDPLDVAVAQIHEEIQQLLLVHRNIYDGFVLAADQVQDKRIEWIEDGPKVEAAAVFIDFVLVFFLGSPLLKNAFLGAFRFAGNGVISRRSELISKLISHQERLRGAKTNYWRSGQELSLNLRKTKEILNSTKDQSVWRKTWRELKDLESKHKNWVNEGKDLFGVSKSFDDRLTNLQQSNEVSKAKLLEFFNSSAQLAAEYGVATVGAGVSTAKTIASMKPSSETQSVGNDSIGVQIKSLAQDNYRNIELYLGLTAADADLLKSVGRSDPLLAPVCGSMASEILDVLRRGPGNSESSNEMNLKKVTALETEKLIWALLVSAKFETNNDAPPSEMWSSTGRAHWGDAAAIGLAHLGRDLYFSLDDAPVGMYEYFQARFFGEENLTSSEVFERLRIVAKNFRAVQSDVDLFHVTSIKFRKSTTGSE